MLNLHFYRMYPWTGRLLILSVIALCDACASAPNPALQEARLEHMKTRLDPEVERNAPAAFQEAEQTLRQAEQAKDKQEVEHWAYMAKQQTQIARAEAQQKTIEARAKAKAEAWGQQVGRELAELRAKKTERGYVLTLGDVLFDPNQASLRPGAQQDLYRLATFLKEHPEQRVLIEGHTDSMGSESYNLELSQLRAQAVQDFLIRNGIRPERITARGYGKAYPVASNDTAAGRQQNRRVEVIFSEQPRPVVMLER